MIGNDIIDLAEPGVADKERDRRFVDRVFTPAERDRIMDAAAPTLALWKSWAAKETAYKIAGKIRGKLVFAHKAFEVAAGDREGLVRFEDLVVRVCWEAGPSYVHCVGCLVPGEGAGEGCVRRTGAAGPSRFSRLITGVAHHLHPLGGTLTSAEEASVHSLASARVRLLARRLMERWNLDGAEIVRLWHSRGWSPPVVARNRRPVAGFDVSLSHDGRFVAAALIGPG